MGKLFAALAFLQIALAAGLAMALSERIDSRASVIDGRIQAYVRLLGNRISEVREIAEQAASDLSEIEQTLASVESATASLKNDLAALKTAVLGDPATGPGFARGLIDDVSDLRRQVEQISVHLLEVRGRVRSICRTVPDCG